MKNKVLNSESKIHIRFTVTEWSTLVNATFVDSDVLESAIHKGNAIGVLWSLEDIDDVIGHVAAAANHPENAPLERRLSRLLEKLECIVGKHLRATSKMGRPVV